MNRFALGIRVRRWQTPGVGIKPHEFRQIQERLERTGRRPSPVMPVATVQAPRTHQILLGIDPSLRGTGFGIIQLLEPHPRALAFGTIACPAGWEHSRCLLHIAQTLRDVLRQHHPTLCVMEGLFFAQNLRTSLILGEARGACMVAVAEAGLEIYELAPRKVKQAIVGYGAAQKLAVAKMVQRLLCLAEVPEADAADALAVALAHAQSFRRYGLGAPKRI